MARRRVPVNPMQKALGDDYLDDETMGKLAYLSQNEQNPNFNLIGTSTPEVSAEQQYQDVPRQMAVRESFEEEFLPEDLNGLELLGRSAEDEAYEDSLDAVAETEPPEQYLAPIERFMSVLDDETRGQIFGTDEQVGKELPEDTIDYFSDNLETDVEPGVYAGKNIPSGDVIEAKDSYKMIEEALESNPELFVLLPPETRNLLKNGNEEQVGIRKQDVVEMLKPQSGAIEAALKDDQVMEFLREADDRTNPYDKKVIEDGIAISNLFSKREEDRTKREEELAKSLKSGNLTSEEIVSLGLAIVVPALLALFYGKDAALGAIAGGLKGTSEFFSNKQPDKKFVNQELGKLSEERKKDSLEELKLKKDLLKDIDSPKVRKFLENRQLQLFESGKKIGIEVDPQNNLYLDYSKLKGDREFEKWDKDENKDREALSNQIEINESLENIKDLMLELKKQNPSLLTTLVDNFKGYIPKSWRDLTPESLKFLKTEPINILVNGEVRQVDPLRQLEQLLAKFQTAYINMNNMDNRLTNNVKDHLADVLPNPGSFLQWFSQDIDDFIEKVNTLKNETNRRFIKNAEINGYLADPLKASLPYGEYQVIDQDAIQKGFRSVLSEPQKNISKVVR